MHNVKAKVNGNKCIWGAAFFSDYFLVSAIGFEEVTLAEVLRWLTVSLESDEYCARSKPSAFQILSNEGQRGYGER